MGSGSEQKNTITRINNKSIITTGFSKNDAIKYLNYTNYNYTFFEGNKIKHFNRGIKTFKKNDFVVVQKISLKNSGVSLEIVSSIKKREYSFKYSTDSVKVGKKDSLLENYLNNYIYEKIKNININLFPGLKINVFGFIGSDGFLGTDIFVNSNFLDIALIEKIFKKYLIKTPNIIFSGYYNDFRHELYENFIIRLYNEKPKERNIFIKKQKNIKI